jgi:helix-turn-helix protein
MISPERPSVGPGQVPVAAEEALQKPAGPLLDAKGHEANRWAAQVERLGQEAPVALASTLRRRAAGVEDEATLRATLGELGYDDEVADRASRRARGGMRRPRFVRTAALTFLAAALALQQSVPVQPSRGGFTWAATKAMEGRFERHVRASGERGVNRATFGSVWRVLADHANQHGFCFPSVPTIGREGLVSERSVQRTIEIAEELGFLMVYPRDMERGVPLEWQGAPKDEIAGGRSHMYLLLPDGLEDEQEASPASSTLPTTPASSPSTTSPMTSPSSPTTPPPRPVALAPIPSTTLAAIAPVGEPPAEWVAALRAPLQETRQRLGLAVPLEVLLARVTEMGVDTQRGVGSTALAVEQARGRALNERAAGKKVDELRFLEIVRVFLSTARPAPAPSTEAPNQSLEEDLRDTQAIRLQKDLPSTTPICPELRKLFGLPSSRAPPKRG